LNGIKEPEIISDKLSEEQQLSRELRIFEQLNNDTIFYNLSIRFSIEVV